MCGCVFYVCACVFVCLCVCVSVCLCVCVYVFICLLIVYFVGVKKEPAGSGQKVYQNEFVYN